MMDRLQAEPDGQIKITLPPELRSTEVQQIFAALKAAGGAVRFVGGCVRDAVLGKSLSDIDIATSLLPENVTQALETAGMTVIPTGLQHGTVTVVSNKKHFEVTTLRRDVEHFGRHATVAYTDSFEVDAARRDFTINAMYCDEAGNVFDYFGGYNDLQKGIVRFIGNADDRVTEDFLRILRFFRFYARYGKSPMDIEALKSISRHASSIATLSGERIQKEMLGLFSSRYLDNIIETMAESQILPHIFLPCNHFVPFHELLMLEEQISFAPQPLLRLAILLRTTQDPMHYAHLLAKRWRLSQKDEAVLYDLVNQKLLMAELSSECIQKRWIRDFGKERFIRHVLLAWAEFLANETQGDKKLDPRFAHMLNLAETWGIPIFPITGKDVLGLGYREGRQVGQILEKAEAWWEEQHYTPSKTDILNYIRKMVF